MARRSPIVLGETRAMQPASPDLERQLLRRGVGELVAHRDACHVCRRTPLVGELVYVFPGEKLVCVLCRPAQGDEPLRSETVRSSVFGHAVRLRAA